MAAFGEPFQCPKCGRTSTAKFSDGDLTVCQPCAYGAKFHPEPKGEA